LDISKLEGGSVTPERRPILVGELFDRLKDDLLPSVEEKGLHLRIAAHSVTVYSDPLLLMEMLQNLLVNAVRYTRKGGVLLAARRDVLIEKKAFFDERFQFHFYDLDFCRTAKSSGLQPGTWPISITHQGRGNWNNPEWRSALQSYLSKWAAHPGAL
nr:hypothetical protein [Ottowia sp.]